LHDGPAAPEGLAPYGGAALPGPLGIDRDHADGRATALSESRPGDIGAAEGVSASFVLNADRYRLLRLDAEWRQGFDEVVVPAPEAAAIIEQATRQYEGNRDIVHQFEIAASRLAGLHDDGVFVLLRKQWFGGGASVAQTVAASTPSMFRPASPPELLRSIEEPAMGAAQAIALKNAAAAGVPFCEECARAAAQHQPATPQ
jgi:hypothetical protein